MTSPDPKALGYAEYAQAIETDMPAESPPLYGMHPNSEIAFLFQATETIFSTMRQLKAGSGGGGSGGNDAVNATIDKLLEDRPEPFDMLTINDLANPMFLSTEPEIQASLAPFLVCALQECTAMNVLLAQIVLSLEELQKGLAGALNMSGSMEDLAIALSIIQVPGRNPFHRASWEKMAWPSMKNLWAWYIDVENRCNQLRSWSGDLQTPNSTWLPGLFNPVAFLTAVKQACAREKKLSLDQMCVETHITTLPTPADCEEFVHPPDGKFIHGLFIDGCRWTLGDEAEEHEGSVSGYTGGDVEGIPCAGTTLDSRLKELLPPLPLIYVKSVETQPSWESTVAGFMRHEDDQQNHDHEEQIAPG